MFIWFIQNWKYPLNKDLLHPYFLSLRPYSYLEIFEDDVDSAVIAFLESEPQEKQRQASQPEVIEKSATTFITRTHDDIIFDERALKHGKFASVALNSFSEQCISSWERPSQYKPSAVPRWPSMPPHDIDFLAALFARLLSSTRN